jgi:hypothetical protein
VPTDPTLKPIHRDPTFWVLLVLSIPGLLAAFLAAAEGIRSGSFDPNDFYAAVFAAPIVIYLGIGREYARGKAVEATGRILTAQVQPPTASASINVDGAAVAEEVGKILPSGGSEAPQVPASLAEAARRQREQAEADTEFAHDAPDYEPTMPEVRDHAAESIDARGEQA